MHKVQLEDFDAKLKDVTELFEAFIQALDDDITHEAMQEMKDGLVFFQECAKAKRSRLQTEATKERLRSQRGL